MKFPEHKASLHLTHNDHKSCYETVAEVADDDWHKGTWISEEEKALSIKHNDMWEIQWYPETPIGFYKLSAYNLNKLLEKACKYEY